ncbi:hypothetical protein D918_03276 [Trichuris suis]|nr:hypothetical protein D918_03276 [Trichuris suis]
MRNFDSFPIDEKAKKQTRESQTLLRCRRDSNLLKASPFGGTHQIDCTFVVAMSLRRTDYLNVRWRTMRHSPRRSRLSKAQTEMTHLARARLRYCRLRAVVPFFLRHFNWFSACPRGRPREQIELMQLRVRVPEQKEAMRSLRAAIAALCLRPVGH